MCNWPESKVNLIACLVLQDVNAVFCVHLNVKVNVGGVGAGGVGIACRKLNRKQLLLIGDVLKCYFLYVEKCLPHGCKKVFCRNFKCA